MNITCPHCGGDFPLVAGVNDAEARRFAAHMGELPPAAARLMVSYLALHKPLKRGLRWSKLVAVLGDLLPEIKSATVVHDGVTAAAPHELWIAALQTVIDMENLTLPLKGNGLLRKVIAGLAQKSAGTHERKKEDQQRYRYHRDTHARGPQRVEQVIDRVAGQEGARKLREVIK